MVTENKMTIYYRKSTGIIQGMCTMVNDMSWYGVLQSEYELTHSFIIVDIDEYVINNLMQFKVEDGKLKLKSADLSKYV